MTVAHGNHTGSVAAANSSNNHSNADENSECTVREQDRFMPIANVIRIMRKILPPHAKISDDAKETIQECVSEYISFITGEANDRCQREQRKTITAEDVLWAMSKLGFDDYIEPLTIYLHRYREMEGDRGSLRGEPFMKRAVDYGSLGVPAAFTRGFPMAGPAGPHPAYFGAPPMGGYFKDGNPSHEGSSNGAIGNGEAHGQFE
ncbi:CBFD_NFYB_HMF domain-containing protein [Psidium guajava]|nr:CBFD_NFYB_HMF domain-containing protein [Psidium guajava]